VEGEGNLQAALAAASLPEYHVSSGAKQFAQTNTGGLIQIGGCSSFSKGSIEKTEIWLYIEQQD
jgi:hypothetical protein